MTLPTYGFIIAAVLLIGAIGWAIYLALPAAKAAVSKPQGDALATFNELVASLKAAGKLDDAVQASIIAIREAVSEICMPLDTDGDV